MTTAADLPPPPTPTRGFVDPTALARLKGLSLRSRRVVDGVLQGMHKSPHQGASVEFAEHKEYAPGDEIKHVDWRAYARFDKYYVKKYEQETNLQALFVVDASASMAYGAEGALTKFEYAGVVATSLGWLLLRQQDAVGLVKYADAVSEIVPPRSRVNHLSAISTALEKSKVKGGTNLEAGLEAVVQHGRRRGMVYVLSDFFNDDSAKAFDMLRQLVGRGQQITVFHVLDGDELTFPFERMTLFEGMETKRRLLVEPRLVRKAYLQRMQEHQADVRRRCLEARVAYELVDTRLAPGDIVLRWLRASERARRGR